MRLLLTGGTGYLGRHLLAGLRSAGHDVVLLLHGPDSLSRLPEGQEYRFFDPDRLPGLFCEKGFDGVVNLAAVYGRRGEPYPDLLRANCLYPLQVLEAALACEVPLFVNAGTSLPASLNPYALSKRQFADWGRLLCSLSSLSFVNLEIEHFYGPGDAEEKFTSWLFRQLLAGVPEIRLTEGRQKRDFIHIEDLVDAMICLLDRAEELPDGWLNVPVGSGESIPVRQFAELARRLAGTSTRLNFGAVPTRPGEPDDLCADLAFLRRLGWRPKLSIEEGIAKTLAAGG